MMQKPWYKEFWPWFLIAIPTASMVMGAVLLKLAVSTQDSLVVDDYYKQGKAINASLAKQEAARRLNVQARVTIDKGAVSVQFASGAPANGQALQLNFYHTTLADRDFSLLLTRDAGGRYRGYTEQASQGKWQMTLTPLDENWKIQQQIWLPASSPIVLEP